jgi:hypothetical protein
LFVELGVGWSKRLDELAAVRMGLRERVKGSLLGQA